MINLTVFSDASHRNGIAGGGYWIVYGDHQKVQGGCAFVDVQKSHEAELLVSRHAIQVALNHKDIKAWIADRDVRVILVVDALSTKTELEKNPPCKNLKINHVKGHSNDSSPRSHVNRWCDKEAKRCRLAMEAPK